MVQLTKEGFKEIRKVCKHMHIYGFNWHGKYRSVYRCWKKDKEVPCTLHNCPVCELKEGEK